MNKKNVFLILIALFISYFVGKCYLVLKVDGSIGESLVLDFITTITAITGVVGLIISAKSNHDLDEAEFIVKTNLKYIDHKEYQELLSVLEQDNNINWSDIEDDVVQFLDFFEPVYILLDKKLIGIEVINDLFSYRFFTVVNNYHVQDNLIGKHPEYYDNIIRLHYIWSTYRTKHSMELPSKETDLSKNSWYEERAGIKKSKEKTSKTITTVNQVNIRKATKEDVSFLNHLYAELMEKSVFDENTSQKIESINKREDNYIFVAEVNGEIAGTIQCAFSESLVNNRPYMTIEYFIVDKKYRKNGIGTALLKKAKEIAAEKEATEIFLVSGKTRKNAHKLYKSFGFNNEVKGFRIDF